MVTTVYLIRHVQAIGNVKGFFQGHTDCELSPLGLKQALCLQERFKDIKLDRIYSSPLVRAMETAKAVNFYHNLDIIKNEGLIEINGGLFEKQLWADIAKNYPKELDLWLNSPNKFVIENGDSMQSVYDRMVMTVKQIAEENDGRTIAIVSHGCAIKNFLCYANNIPLANMNKLGWSDNSAVSKFIFKNGLIQEIIYENDDSHLPEELKTLKKQDWWKIKPIDNKVQSGRIL